MDIHSYKAQLSPQNNFRNMQLDENGKNLVHDTRSFRELFVLNKSTKNANAKLAYDFRLALVKEYGRQVADCVFAKHIGKPGSRITSTISSHKLQAAITMADASRSFKAAISSCYGDLAASEMFAKHIAKSKSSPSEFLAIELMAKEGTNLRGLGQDYRRGVSYFVNAVKQNDFPNEEALNSVDMDVMKLIEHCQSRIHELHSLSPGNNNKDITSLREEHRAIMSKLDNVAAFASRNVVSKDPKWFAGALADYTTRLNHTLENLIGQVELMESNLNKNPAIRPMSLKATQEFARNWAEAGVQVAVQKFSSDNRAVVELHKRLTDLTTALKKNDYQLLQAGEFKDAMLEAERKVLDLLKKCYREAGLDSPKNKVIKKELRQAWVTVMNGKEWKPINKTVTVSHDGVPLQLKSVIVPAGQLRRNGESVFGEYAGNGISCASFSSPHAVNLCTTSMTVPVGNGAVSTFKGLRHGINSAVGISNPEQRRQANLQRAREIVLTAALLKIEEMGSAPIPSPLKLSLTSLSLVSPDVFRRNESDEAKMLRDQTESWKGMMDLLKNNPNALGIVHGDRPVAIELDIATFNYGVNAGAMHWYGRPLGIWNNSEKINGSPNGREAFKRRVQGFLTDNPTHPNAQKIATLQKQIEKIWADESFRSQGGEPYKLVARLAVLTSLMGDIPLWNCKSGKDRTGQLDVETKFLFAKIALGDAIPEPDAPLSREDKLMLRSIALEGGNHEIQVLNTGMAGFKLGNVPINYHRIGNDEGMREIHKGGASFVKA